MRKRVRLLFIFIVFVASTGCVSAMRIQYAEQFYKLYHQSLYRYPEDSAENIWYLSMALRSPFASPLNALATIENEIAWEKYRQLFTMHVYLEIVDEYLALAKKYDKFNAYFYNYPWKSANLDSLRVAEKYYKLALDTWFLAEKHGFSVRDTKYRWIHIEEIQHWEDEAHRIETRDLDYADIIQDHLERLYRVRDEFNQMNPDTY